MGNTNSIICPVDFVMINENKVRITAFFVLLIAVSYMLTDNWLIVIFLLADFLLRILNFNNYSPLAVFSGFIINYFGIKHKQADRAPKRFAAIVGLVFLCIILVTSLARLQLASRMLTAMLILFASLEAFAGLCVGCYLYTLINRIKIIKKL